MRNAFINTLTEMAETNRDIVLLTGDLGFSVVERFQEKFPDRFFNCGVAEQNMIGMAAGLALEGFVPVVYSLTNFGITRALEQIRNDVCQHNLPVIIVTVGAGLAYGPQGYSHHGVEDIGMARSLPNMAVVSPGDPAEAMWATRELIKRRGPASLRLARGGEPDHGGSVEHMPFPMTSTYRPARSLGTIIAHGTAIDAAGAATIALGQQDVHVGCYSMPCATPFDYDELREICAITDLIVTVEEHKRGGFGSIVADFVSQLAEAPPRVVQLTLGDTPMEGAASQATARILHGLDAESISRRTLEALAEMEAARNSAPR